MNSTLHPTSRLGTPWLKLLLAWATLQTLAVFSLVSSSDAADPTEGRLEKSKGEVRPVRNDAEYRPHVGLMAGYNNLNGPVNGAVIGGVDAGFQPIVPISVGLQFQHSPSDYDFGLLEENFDTTNLLAKVAWNFGGDIPVLKSTYLGARTGVAWYKFLDNTDTHFALGPVLGMDFPLGATGKFTIGPEFSYLGVLGDNSPDQAMAAANAKYWF